MGFSVMLWGAEKLVPVEYWCPYGTITLIPATLGENLNTHMKICPVHFSNQIQQKIKEKCNL